MVHINTLQFAGHAENGRWRSGICADFILIPALIAPLTPESVTKRERCKRHAERSDGTEYRQDLRRFGVGFVS
jgi:hypothetical protein